jgi:hypothetical protein
VLRTWAQLRQIRRIRAVFCLHSAARRPKS